MYFDKQGEGDQKVALTEKLVVGQGKEVKPGILYQEEVEEEGERQAAKPVTEQAEEAEEIEEGGAEEASERGEEEEEEEGEETVEEEKEVDKTEEEEEGETEPLSPEAAGSFREQAYLLLLRCAEARQDPEAKEKYLAAYQVWQEKSREKEALALILQIEKGLQSGEIFTSAGLALPEIPPTVLEQLADLFQVKEEEGVVRVNASEDDTGAQLEIKLTGVARVISEEE